MTWPLAPSRLAVVEHLGHKSDGRISHIVGPVLPTAGNTPYFVTAAHGPEVLAQPNQSGILALPGCSFSVGTAILVRTLPPVTERARGSELVPSLRSVGRRPKSELRQKPTKSKEAFESA
jgi:hypothetical protein